MRRIALSAAVLALALPGAAAQAATVRVDAGHDCAEKNGCVPVRELVVTSDDARDDALRLSFDGATTITDALHELRAAAGCEQVDPRTVRCGGLPLTAARVETGDGDDGVLLTGAARAPYVDVDGGGGADRLSVAPGAPLRAGLDGGGGDDALSGGGRRDLLV